MGGEWNIPPLTLELTQSLVSNEPCPCRQFKAPLSLECLFTSFPTQAACPALPLPYPCLRQQLLWASPEAKCKPDM